MNKNIYSVSQVNTYIERMFADDFMLGNLSLSGEVSNCKYNHTGHIYFTLKDEKSAISCVMFAGKRAKGLKFPMKDGDQVVVSGYVGIYAATGRYQVYASEIELAGVGDHLVVGLGGAEAHHLEARLQEEGLGRLPGLDARLRRGAEYHRGVFKQVRPGVGEAGELPARHRVTADVGPFAIRRGGGDLVEHVALHARAVDHQRALAEGVRVGQYPVGAKLGKQAHQHDVAAGQHVPGQRVVDGLHRLRPQHYLAVDVIAEHGVLGVLAYAHGQRSADQAQADDADLHILTPFRLNCSYSLLPPPYSLLPGSPNAYCLMPTAYCLLPYP